MRSTKKNTEAVANLLAQTASWYPDAPSGSDLQRRAHDWVHELRRFELVDIEAAFKTARNESPDHFPTVGKVQSICTRVLTERTEARREEERKRRDDADAEEHRAWLNRIPVGEIDREAWIDAAPNACERLGRQWAIESRNEGRGPGFRLPVEVVRARVAQLIAAIGD